MTRPPAPRSLATLALCLCAMSPLATAQHDAAHHHAGAGPASASATVSDKRQPVVFPAPMKTHTLSNMRDHLVALAQIQEALGNGAYERAAQTAEQALGMSSLASHGAHEVAQFMPPAMQAMGSAMHRSASQFAVEAQNSAATGDLKPALAALARTTQACTACHAAFRLE
jgi:cytochrome c556